jgi:hypothetical protein
MNFKDRWMIGKIFDLVKEGKELSNKARTAAVKDVCEGVRISVEADRILDDAMDWLKSLYWEKDDD